MIGSDTSTDGPPGPDALVVRLRQVVDQLPLDRQQAFRDWCSTTAVSRETPKAAKIAALSVHLATPVEQTSLQDTAAPPPELELAAQSLRSSKLIDGRYELLEKVGEGAYSTVFRAKDRRLNTFVAVKLLRVELTSEPAMLAELGRLFNREAQTQAPLSHPNIARVLDASVTAQGVPYIVTEFLEGELLSDRLKARRALPLKQVTVLLEQLCSAVQYAHDEKVVHRDLKPGNIILVEQHGQPLLKVLDFGLAMLVDQAHLTLPRGAVIGTPAYMSPEQWDGNRATPLSDIYAIGVILYEMVTGRLPFESEDHIQLERLHCESVPPNPSTYSSGLPKAVSSLIIRTLDKNPRRRPASAHELFREYQQAVIKKPKTGRQLAKTLTAITAVAAVVTLVVVGWRYLPQFRLDRELREGRSRLEQAIATNDVEQAIAYFEKACSTSQDLLKRNPNSDAAKELAKDVIANWVEYARGRKGSSPEAAVQIAQSILKWAPNENDAAALKKEVLTKAAADVRTRLESANGIEDYKTSSDEFKESHNQLQRFLALGDKTDDFTQIYELQKALPVAWLGRAFHESERRLELAKSESDVQKANAEFLEARNVIWEMKEAVGGVNGNADAISTFMEKLVIAWIDYGKKFLPDSPDVAAKVATALLALEEVKTDDGLRGRVKEIQVAPTVSGGGEKPLVSRSGGTPETMLFDERLTEARKSRGFRDAQVKLQQATTAAQSDAKKIRQVGILEAELLTEDPDVNCETFAGEIRRNVKNLSSLLEVEPAKDAWFRLGMLVRRFTEDDKERDRFIALLEAADEKVDGLDRSVNLLRSSKAKLKGLEGADKAELNETFRILLARNLRRKLPLLNDADDFAPLLSDTREAAEGSSDGWAWTIRAECLLRFDRDELKSTSSIEDWEAVSKKLDDNNTLMPVGSYGYFVRGLVCQANKQWKEAVQNYDQAFPAKKPDDSKLWRNEARLKLASEAYHKAAVATDDTDPASAFDWYKRASELNEADALRSTIPLISSALRTKQPSKMEWAEKLSNDLLDAPADKLDIYSVMRQNAELRNLLGNKEGALKRYATIVDKRTTDKAEQFVLVPAVEFYEKVIGPAIDLCKGMKDGTAEESVLDKIYSQKGRLIQEYDEADWQTVLKGDPWAEAVDAYDMAIRHHPDKDRTKAEYYTLRGFARTHVPGITLDKIKQEDALSAINVASGYSGGYALRGFILDKQGERDPDYSTDSRGKKLYEDAIKDHETAIRLAEEAVRRGERNDDLLHIYYTNSSATYTRYGNHLDYLRALKLISITPEVLREKFLKAQGYAEKATKLRDDYILAWRALGNAWEDVSLKRLGMQTEHFADAIAAFEKERDLRPSVPDSHVSLGRCYVEMIIDGDSRQDLRGKARDELDFAISKLDGGHSEANYWMGQLLLLENQRSDALRAFAKAIKRPEGMRRWFPLVGVAMNVNNPQEIRQLLDDAIAGIDGTPAEAHAELFYLRSNLLRRSFSKEDLIKANPQSILDASEAVRLAKASPEQVKAYMARYNARREAADNAVQNPQKAERYREEAALEDARKLVELANDGIAIGGIEAIANDAWKRLETKGKDPNVGKELQTEYYDAAILALKILIKNKSDPTQKRALEKTQSDIEKARDKLKN